MSASENHQAIALGRVAAQYKASPRFLAFLGAIVAPLDELEALFQIIALQSDIDVAAGTQLDVIGDIVGVSRTIPASIPISSFGFEDSVPDASIFGELTDPSIGSRFRNLREAATASTVVADPEFRLLIRAKIVKNHSHGYGNEIIAGLAYVFDIDEITIDEGDMTMQVGIGRILTFQEKAMISDLDILPRPQGVKITQILGYTGTFPGFD